MRRKIIFLLTIMLALIISLAACDEDGNDTNDAENKNEKGTLEISMPPWVNSPPQVWMVKLIIEEHLGWDVEITEADIGLSFASTANGTTDFFVDAWLPGSHDPFVEEHGDDIEVLEPFTEVPPNGLIVPDYVYEEIQSIDELNDYVDELNGEIIGIEPGSGIMDLTEEAMEEYDLNFNLIEGSDFAMTAAIEDAIANEEWIVATGWSPHWMFTLYDLEYLDDPEDVYGGIRDIYPIVHKDLPDKAPEVIEFLNNFEVDGEVWDDLINQTAVEEVDPEVAVKEWIDDNEDLVESWLP